MDRLPLLNVREGPVWYEMKYPVIPKAMNPSRNSHCKTSQIMRNTFASPHQHGEERCGLLFGAVGLLENLSSSHETLDREREQRRALSPSWFEQTARAHGWKVWPHQKEFTN